MYKLPALLTGLCITLTSFAQVEKTQPVLRNTHAVLEPSAARTSTADSVLADITDMFARMEQQLAMEFAKLIKEAKDNKTQLEEQIKQIDRHIDNLKKQVKKLDLMMQKIDQLLPRFMHQLDSVKRSPNGLLFPEKSASIQKTIDSLKDERAAIPVRINDINNEVYSQATQKKVVQQQIQYLDSQVTQLNQSKQQQLALLQQQKQKTIEEALKVRNENRQQYKNTLQLINNRQVKILQDSLRFIKQRMTTGIH